MQRVDWIGSTHRNRSLWRPGSSTHETKLQSGKFGIGVPKKNGCSSCFSAANRRTSDGSSRVGLTFLYDYRKTSSNILDLEPVLLLQGIRVRNYDPGCEELIPIFRGTRPAREISHALHHQGWQFGSPYSNTEDVGT